MAIVTRYFSTTSAGAGDGTSWANRAALFSAGNWSSVITGFNFAGSDSLTCLIEGGLTYTCSQQLAAALFANAPTSANPLILHGCNSSGNLLSPPDPDWTSDQPAWSTSTLPTIATTTDVGTYYGTANAYYARLVRFTASGRTTGGSSGGGVIYDVAMDWCAVEGSTNNSNAQLFNTWGNYFSQNCVFRQTGASFDLMAGIGPEGQFHNCLFHGPGTSGGSGRRMGVDASGLFGNNSSVGILTRCTIRSVAGIGWSNSSSSGVSTRLQNCVIASTGGSGVFGTNVDGKSSVVSNCVIVNCGGWGIDVGTGGRFIIANNRLRNNTSGSITGTGSGNYPTDFDNETAAGTDADEFVDAAGGDYRIKNTSSIWGKGYGVSDQPAAGGSTRGYIIGG